MAETHRHILMASTMSGAAGLSGSTGPPDKDAPTDTSTPGTPFSARKRGKKGKGKRKGRHPSHAAAAEGNVIELSKPMHGLDNPDEISKDGKVEEYTGDNPPKGPHLNACNCIARSTSQRLGHWGEGERWRGRGGVGERRCSSPHHTAHTLHTR